MGAAVTGTVGVTVGAIGPFVGVPTGGSVTGASVVKAVAGVGGVTARGAVPCHLGQTASEHRPVAPASGR